MKQARAQTPARLKAILAPSGFSDVLLQALDRTLSASADHFGEALLAKAEYEGGVSAFLLVVTGVPTNAYAAFTEMVDEAITSAGRSDIALDVTYLAQDDPGLERLRRVGLAVWPKQNKSRNSTNPRIAGAVQFKSRNRV